MLKNVTQTINVNANSVINDVPVLMMRATIMSDGTISYGKTVRDKDLYLENLEQCDADYAEFEAEVRKLV